MPGRAKQFGGDELSRTLRQLREAANLSGLAAGKAAGFPQAKVSRIENGVKVPTPKDVATLAEVYGAAAEVRRCPQKDQTSLATSRVNLSQPRNGGSAGLDRLADEVAVAHTGTESTQ